MAVEEVERLSHRLCGDFRIVPVHDMLAVQALLGQGTRSKIDIVPAMGRVLVHDKLKRGALILSLLKSGNAFLRRSFVIELAHLQLERDNDPGLRDIVQVCWGSSAWDLHVTKKATRVDGNNGAEGAATLRRGIVLSRRRKSRHCTH